MVALLPCDDRATIVPSTIIVPRALPRGPNEEICIIISNSSHWLVLYLRGHYHQTKPKPQRYTQSVEFHRHLEEVESCTFAPPPAKDNSLALASCGLPSSIQPTRRCNGNQSTDFRRWRTTNCTPGSHGSRWVMYCCCWMVEKSSLRRIVGVATRKAHLHPQADGWLL